MSRCTEMSLFSPSAFCEWIAPFFFDYAKYSNKSIECFGSALCCKRRSTLSGTFSWPYTEIFCECRQSSQFWVSTHLNEGKLILKCAFKFVKTTNSGPLYSLMFLHWVRLPLYPRFDIPEYYGFGRKVASYLYV